MDLPGSDRYCLGCLRLLIACPGSRMILGEGITFLCVQKIFYKNTYPSSRDRTSDIKITNYSLALFQLSYRRVPMRGFHTNHIALIQHANLIKLELKLPSSQLQWSFPCVGEVCLAYCGLRVLGCSSALLFSLHHHPRRHFTA